MDMNLDKLLEMVRDREAWRAAVHGVTKSWTQLGLNNNNSWCRPHHFHVDQLLSCDPIDCSLPGFPVPHHLLKFTQIHVHYISDAIQPSHILTPSSPSVLNLSQHQRLFQ